MEGCGWRGRKGKRMLFLGGEEIWVEGGVGTTGFFFGGGGGGR